MTTENLAANLIGSVLLDPSHLELLRRLHPVAFGSNLANVRGALLALADRRAPIDTATVAAELRRLGKAELVPVALATIETVPTGRNAEHFARELSRAWAKLEIARELQTATRQIAEAEAPEQFVAEHTARLQGLVADAASDDDSVSATDALEAALLEDRSEGRPRGWPLPWIDLRAVLGPLVRGGVYVIGARTNVGKSIAALQTASCVAEAGAQVLFVSLEMTSRENARRLLAASADVDPSFLGQMTIEESARVARVREALAHVGLRFWDQRSTRRLTISRLEALLRRHKLRGQLDVAVIDYLQLLAPDRQGERRERELADIVERIKALAMELEVAIVLPAQLNRESTRREDQVPRLSDLRDSGAIEQSADVVLLLHRPALVDETADRDLIEVTVAKQRSRPAGVKVALRFRGDRCRLEDAP